MPFKFTLMAQACQRGKIKPQPVMELEVKRTKLDKDCNPDSGVRCLWVWDKTWGRPWLTPWGSPWARPWPSGGKLP